MPHTELGGSPARLGPVDLQERIDLRWFNELFLEVIAQYVLERAGTNIVVGRQPPETSFRYEG